MPTLKRPTKKLLTNEYRSKYRRCENAVYMILEHIPSKLQYRHPATGRDVYGTNDLDVAFRNPMRPNSPSAAGHMVVCYGILREKRYNR